MQKQPYVKPTVTKLGSLVQKTEGSWTGMNMELMSLRP